jgi:large subunit ribosomal protein L24
MKTLIKKGDKVMILAGKDKGKSGKVLEVVSDKGRALVEGLNMVKKHMRKRSETERGGIKEIPAGINLSNLALFCPSCSKGVRVSVKSEGKVKTRLCKKCNNAI